MEIKWIEDFLCLSRVGSFSKCAERKNVTQPAFSRRIKALETWLGVDLINRATYPVTLTPEGVEFKIVAEQIILQLNSAKDRFKNKWRASELDISFASLDSLSTSFFPSWLKQLEKNTTLPATQLLQNNLKECEVHLERDDCDFVLCYTHSWAKNPLEHNDNTSTVLAYEKLIPVCQSDENGQPAISSLATKDSPIPILAYSQDCFLGQVMEVAMNKLNKNHSFKIVYENATATSLKVMVEHGYGIAWIPERLVKKEIQNGELAIIPEFNWIPHLGIRLYRSKKVKRQTVETFWNQIRTINSIETKIPDTVIKKNETQHIRPVPQAAMMS